MKKYYSLNYCRRILLQNFKIFKRKKNKINKEDADIIIANLSSLKESILKKDRPHATEYSRKIKKMSSTLLQKSFFDHAIECLGAIIFALIFATVIRQTWFEPYEIPTGSMRPTFKERDRLVVTKTDFGFNIPLKPKHFYLEKNNIKHTDIVTFTVQNMDVEDGKTNYFGIFPGYKRYIKRIIGKPGDSIYFYGGKIYGVDQNGNDITILRDNPELEKIDHVPYIRFEGRNKGFEVDKKTNNISSTIYQFNQPIGRVVMEPNQNLTSYIIKGSDWLKENYINNTSYPQHYSDFYGIGNFSIARLLEKADLPSNIKLEEAPLYLELLHHPSVSNFHLIKWPTARLSAIPEKSYLPLQEEHLQRIINNMYTARFSVLNNLATRYHPGKIHTDKNNPYFKDLDDGNYEFYYGEAYKLKYGSIPEKLPPNHPLYATTPENIKKLFNLGMEFHNLFNPNNQQTIFLPSRFAYFRDGNLYLMGAPIVYENEPVLKSFINRELIKSGANYIPFVDKGAPLNKNGTVNVDFIRSFGITIPPKMYLVLGDNHAQSSDSREFGFVPEENLRGAPWFNLWPPGSRWGLHKQHPFFNRTNSAFWLLTASTFVIIILYRKKRVENIIIK